MSNQKLYNIADSIYQSFCEEGGIDSEQLQTVWDEYQDANGAINCGDLTDRLVHAAIRFAVVNFVEINE